MSKSSKKPKSKSKSRARSSSPAASDVDADVFAGGAYVYRAVRQERVALGWSQAPCAKCPVFDFCKNGGPTNPQECTYFGEWLDREVISTES